MQANLRNSHEFPKRRRLATLEGCKVDLSEHLEMMFRCFYEALSNYSVEVQQTPVEARVRAFEASLLNSKIVASIQKHFPKKWKFGKYKRFILRINRYIVLFKKLNNSDRPMNIKTKNVENISSQYSLPLFSADNYVEDPILFFGYKKNKYGDIHDPKFVYIDEDQVKWTLTQNDIDDGSINLSVVEPDKPLATPSLRKPLEEKKKAN